MAKKTTWKCQRVTDLDNGLSFDMRTGMKSNDIYNMFLDDKMDDEELHDLDIKTITKTCYEVHYQDPIYSDHHWAYRKELIPA